MVLGQGREAGADPRACGVARVVGAEHGEHPPLVSWLSKHSSVTHGDVISMVMARRICSLVSRKLESCGCIRKEMYKCGFVTRLAVI
mgnify:CR=1 FL=1